MMGYTRTVHVQHGEEIGGRPLFVCLPSKNVKCSKKKGKKEKNEKRERTQHLLFLLYLFYFVVAAIINLQHPASNKIHAHVARNQYNCNSNKTKSVYALHA
jgi:predicted nucleic acid-binding Zn ribbon protein